MIKKNLNIKNIRRVKNILDEQFIPITTVLNKIGGKFPIKKSSFPIAKKPTVPITKRQIFPIVKKPTVPIVKKLSNISSKSSFSNFRKNNLVKSIVKKNPSINYIVPHVPSIESKINSLKKNNKQPVIQTNTSISQSSSMITKKTSNNKQPVMQTNTSVSQSSTTSSNTKTPTLIKTNNKQSSVPLSTSTTISSNIITTVPIKYDNKQPVLETNTPILQSSSTTTPLNTTTSAFTKSNNKQSTVQTNIITPVSTKPNNKKLVKETNPNNLSLNKYVQTLLSVNNNFTKKTYTDLTPIIDNLLDPAKKLTPKNRFIIKNIINTIFTKNVINSNGINILDKIISKINNTSNIEHKTLLVMIKDNIVLYGKETHYKNILSNIETKLNS